MLLGGGGPTAEPVESLEHGPCDGAVIRFEAGEEIGLAVQVFGDRVRLRAGDGLWGKPLDFFSGSHFFYTVAGSPTVPRSKGGCKGKGEGA